MNDRNDTHARLARIPERGACPTPHKDYYLTRKQAKRALTLMHDGGARKAGGRRGRLHAYLCDPGCGRYHIGSVPYWKIHS